jgi:hypothetical protein
MVAHLKNIQRASAQRRKYGHNQTNAHQHGLHKLNCCAVRVNASLHLAKSRFRRITLPRFGEQEWQCADSPSADDSGFLPAL